MPIMDGFEVLDFMIKEHWNEEIPVIMISSENSPDTMRRAYEMGVVDYISRPFDARVVYQRVLNTIKFYAKQRHLVTLITNQVYEKEKNNRMMISILSQIVEFRNGESGPCCAVWDFEYRTAHAQYIPGQTAAAGQSWSR